MKKKLFVLFCLSFLFMFMNTNSVSAKYVSRLCEYSLDNGVTFSFNLFSYAGDEDFKARYLAIRENGKLLTGGYKVERVYKDKTVHTDWTNFNSRTTCNQYVAYTTLSDGTKAFALFDESVKDAVLNKCALGKSGNDCATYTNYYSVNVTENYNPDGSPLRGEFVGNLTCGNSNNDSEVVTFHKSLPTFTSRMYDFLKILTPVIIIITGMLDIVKAVTSQKEDDMKKAQKKLINRLLAGAVVFLVFVIVEIIINIAADATEAENAMNCVNCFLNGVIDDPNGCTIVTK